MARQIEATPEVSGEDAEQILREIKNVCSPEEVKRRVEKAKKFLEEVSKKVE